MRRWQTEQVEKPDALCVLKMNAHTRKEQNKVDTSCSHYIYGSSRGSEAGSASCRVSQLAGFVPQLCGHMTGAEPVPGNGSESISTSKEDASA